MTAFDDGHWTRLVDEHGADRVAFGSVPERRSKRPLLVGVSGVAAASVAGVLAAVLSLAGGASNAFAGWTAQPTRRPPRSSRPPRPTAPRMCRNRGCR